MRRSCPGPNTSRLIDKFLIAALFLNIWACLAASADQAPEASVLKGHVSASPSPFLSGSVESVPAGAKLDLIMRCNLNSEINQKGDEVFAQVATDLKDGEKVLLPGNWYVHGFVTDIQAQRRLGRDGYVQVEFDKLISPDGVYELPFHAKFSTQDNQVKAVAKVLAIDSGYVSEGALGGAILSIQLTGVPLAVASHGYSVVAGAGVGAALGTFGALKRKGDVASYYPGDEIHLKISEPLALPGFNPSALLSHVERRQLKNFSMVVLEKHLGKDPFGDANSRLLTLSLEVNNQTGQEYSFFDLAIVSDHNQRYYPSLLNNQWRKRIQPNSSTEGSISFSVDRFKHKYWLVLLDKRNRDELTRVPIN